MTTSGTTAFNPAYSDLVLEAFDRIQIRGPEITADHIFSAYSSTNLLLRQWGTRGVNLWAVDVVTVNLSKGVATYNLPADTVQLLDCYLRTFSMGPPTNLTPAFTTVNLSATVQVTWAAHGLSVGSWLNIIVPVAIGGLILLGFYQVLSVIDGNNFTTGMHGVIELVFCILHL